MTDTPLTNEQLADLIRSTNHHLSDEALEKIIQRALNGEYDSEDLIGLIPEDD